MIRRLCRARVLIEKSICVDSREHFHSRAASTPLQETENVRSLVNLFAQFRDANAKGKEYGQQRLPTRLNTRSWADEAKARAASQSKVGDSKVPLMQVESGLEERLRKPKRMIDSYIELALPFKSQPQLLERYIATSANIRLGKVFEDLDSLSGDISYSHVLGGRPTALKQSLNPIFIVTASVDRLDLLEQLRADKDYRLSGMVIYVGSSSMEVLVTIDEMGEGLEAAKTCLTGRFTMATRNALTGRSQRIPPLSLGSKVEEDLFAMGQAHKQRKALEAQSSLEKVPPTTEESALLHRLWLSDQGQGQADAGKEAETDSMDAVKIADTVLYTTSHMHPQQRNVHMKVFGGFLMRSSYETAWMAAALYANKPVTFLSLDALPFHLPVSIGAVLSLTTHVTYTDQSKNEGGEGTPTIASVVVLAEIVDVETGRRDLSNTFHFSFDLGSKNQKKVIPVSYSDSMAWIEGKRRVELGQEVRSSYRLS
ncbi:hypothetical protein CBS101457_002310 [Exobasidium rhododendri]|nr:hypothetical protein CBS101457_002310 [Exobasidium rhododendri]